MKFKHKELARKYWEAPEAYEWREGVFSQRMTSTTQRVWSDWDSDSAPRFLDSCEYEIRRIPTTITLPEREIPEPVWEPVDGEMYWVLAPECEDGTDNRVYVAGLKLCQRFVQRGMYYPLTDEGKKNAIIAAKARFGGLDDE